MGKHLLQKKGAIKNNVFKIIKNKGGVTLKRRKRTCVCLRGRFSKLIHGTKKYTGMTIIINITGLTTLLT